MDPYPLVLMTIRFKISYYCDYNRSEFVLSEALNDCKYVETGRLGPPACEKLYSSQIVGHKLTKILANKEQELP